LAASVELLGDLGHTVVSFGVLGRKGNMTRLFGSWLHLDIFLATTGDINDMRGVVAIGVSSFDNDGSSFFRGFTIVLTGGGEARFLREQVPLVPLIP
jgi:hypothetical protein